MTSNVYRLTKFVVLSVLLCGMGGCTFIEKLLNNGGNDPQQHEPDVKPERWNGPRVRPGIALGITVTASGVADRHSKQYFVDAEGRITMELVGSLKVDGLTLIELQQKIAGAYKEYYVDPSVTATFIYQAGQNMVSPWGTVTILGEVRKPGPVDMPSTEELQLTRAIQLASGLTSIADRRRIQVSRRMDDDSIKKFYINLNEIGEDGLSEKDMKLKAGDVVWVPMSWY